MRSAFGIAFALLALATVTSASEADTFALKIAPLIDPTKLATLAERGANPRVQKYVYWLDTARRANEDPRKVASHAVTLAGYTNKLAIKLTTDAMLRNLDIATKFGPPRPRQRHRQPRTPPQTPEFKKERLDGRPSTASRSAA